MERGLYARWRLVEKERQASFFCARADISHCQTRTHALALVLARIHAHTRRDAAHTRHIRALHTLHTHTTHMTHMTHGTHGTHGTHRRYIRLVRRMRLMTRPPLHDTTYMTHMTHTTRSLSLPHWLHQRTRVQLGTLFMFLVLLCVFIFDKNMWPTILTQDTT